MKTNRILVSAGLAMAAGSGWAATTVVVGPSTCSAVAKHARYDTIQFAVNAVPTGSTVLVCPGTYREQVTINRSLTLKGVADTNTDGNLAVIAVPAGDMTTIGDVGGGQPIAAQLAVTNNSTVDISNLTIDGTGNDIGTCAEDLVGVLFQNASGSLKQSVVVNQLEPPNFVGCQGGLAVFVQTDGLHQASVDIVGNRIANFDKNGITADGVGVDATISSNSVTGLGPTPDIAQNGIQLSSGATGSITGNKVSGSVYTGDTYGASGILVYASPKITVSTNTVTGTQYAIAIVGDGNGDGDGAVINSNVIQDTVNYDAIDLCGSSNNTVTKNTIRGTDEAAIHVEGTTFCGATGSSGNVIETNTIDGACAGVLVGPGAFLGNGKNTFYNTATRTLGGSDVCPVAIGQALPARRVGAKHVQFSPKR